MLEIIGVARTYVADVQIGRIWGDRPSSNILRQRARKVPSSSAMHPSARQITNQMRLF